MDRSGGTRRRAVVLVWLLGAGLIAVAVALNISFIVVNWRAGLLLLVGVAYNETPDNDVRFLMPVSLVTTSDTVDIVLDYII